MTMQEPIVNDFSSEQVNTGEGTDLATIVGTLCLPVMRRLFSTDNGSKTVAAVRFSSVTVGGDAEAEVFSV